MPFRSIEPEVADQLSVLQARRETVRQQIRAGERVRADAEREQQQLNALRPTLREQLRADRCKKRLDSAADASGFWALAFLIGMFQGPIVAIAAVVYVLAGGSWIALGGGVLALGLSVLVVASSVRRSHLRLEAFRAALGALPFTIRGVEETLGTGGTLAEMTITITPVAELPIDAIANLVALVSVDVQRTRRSDSTVAERSGRELVITRRFETFQAEDGSTNETDSSAPAAWFLAVLHQVLLPVHELHAIESVAVSEG